MAVDGRRLEWKRGVSCWFWMILLCAGVWGCGVGQGEISEVEGEAREVLLALLEDRNVDAPLAAEAALMLGKLSELDVVPALVAALAHPEELVVVHAARALGNLGGDRAIAALDSLFQHAESTTLKIETAVILDKLGQAGKRTWLLETLETAPLGIFRSTAAAALGQVGDLSAIPALRRAFHQDGEEIVRSSTALALARLNDRESLPAVANRLQESSDFLVAMSMIEALEVYGDSVAVSHLQAAVRQVTWQYKVRKRCLEALGEIGDRGLGPYLQGLLNGKPDITTQILAVEGLGIIRDTTAIPLLMTSFRSDPTLPLRLGAAWSLAQLGQGREISQELEIDLSLKSQPFQTRAVEVLGLIGDERRISLLKDLFFETSRPGLRQVLVKALGSIRTPEATQVLGEAFIRAKAMEVKEEIVDQLGNQGLEEANEILLNILSQTEYANLQAGAIRGLSRFGDLKKIRVFRWYFRDRMPEVRCQAAIGTLHITRQISFGFGEQAE